MKVQWIIISALVFALVIAIFAVTNVDPVRVNFTFTEAEVPLIIVILASTLLGGLTVGLFGIIRQYKLLRQIRQLTAQLNGEPVAALESDAIPPEQDEAHPAETAER